MRLVTAAEMKELERIAIEDYGLPSLVLMENAGRHVAEVVRQVLGDVRDKTVTIFIGKGNNGGDGLVAARHLVNMGAEVKLLALADMEDFSENAAVNLGIWHKMGQKVYSLLHGDGINIARLILMNTDLIVDAVYGTGFKGKVGEKAGRIFEALNGSGKPIVAVDIPSGLEADSGKVSDSCIQAGHTVTFGLPKLGLLLEPGADYVGNLHVVDISIPAGLVEKYGPQRYLTTPHLVRGWLPNRESAAHKGDFGRVLVVAGSRGMTGAASLCGEAVIRAGAGLVTVAVPETLHDIMEAKLTEVMTASLPDSDKGFGHFFDEFKTFGVTKPPAAGYDDLGFLQINYFSGFLDNLFDDGPHLCIVRISHLDKFTASIVIRGCFFHYTGSDCSHLRHGVRANDCRHYIAAEGGTGLQQQACIRIYIEPGAVCSQAGKNPYRYTWPQVSSDEGGAQQHYFRLISFNEFFHSGTVGLSSVILKFRVINQIDIISAISKQLFGQRSYLITD